MARVVLSIDDLDDDEIDVILRTATERPWTREVPIGLPLLAGLVFLEESLRTRAGFEAALARLGAATVTVERTRSTGAVYGESVEDTVRTIAGMTDLIVARPGTHLDRNWIESNLAVPYISGGGRGPDAEHPSQALIDLYAMERFAGPIASARIALCGDTTMRAAHSLLRLFVRRRPAAIALIAPEPSRRATTLPAELAHEVEWRQRWELDDIDCLYVIGMSSETLTLGERTPYFVDVAAMQALPESATVVSPMPVVDEIAAEVREDRRIRMFEQNAHGAHVRAALIAHLTGLSDEWPGHGSIARHWNARS